MAASMGGHTPTSVLTLIRVSNRHVRIWSTWRSCPTTRSGRTPRHWALSSKGTSLPTQFANGMFVGQHGSWNRKPRSGYKVLFVPFSAGKPSGQPMDVLTGFVRENGDAMGRPVGVAIDGKGALLVADDVGNVIWRVAAGPR